jgi:hypothetical protein
MPRSGQQVIELWVRQGSFSAEVLLAWFEISPLIKRSSTILWLSAFSLSLGLRCSLIPTAPFLREQT